MYMNSDVQQTLTTLPHLHWLYPWQVPTEGVGAVLARGLPQVRLLRLQAGGGGLNAVHEGQPHPVPQGLS